MIGEALGSYRLVSVLGQGGMGLVYVGEHELLGRKAAIKVVLPRYASEHPVVDRFFREAKAASAIKHPGIVEVYDFGHHVDGSAFLVMELLDGESLGTRLRRQGRLPVGESLRLARQIAGALGAAHAAGIVHRDLKPDNIFVVPDPDVTAGERVKLLDFGIAKLSEPTSGATPGELTHTGALLGTPAYMAPEQCRRAGAVDGRADLYSLGCVLFKMIAGQPPFPGTSAGELVAAHLHVEPPLLTEVAAKAPPRLAALVGRLLAKDPAARPASAAEVIAEIDAIAPAAIDTVPGGPDTRRVSEGGATALGEPAIDPLGETSASPLEIPTPAMRPGARPPHAAAVAAAVAGDGKPEVAVTGPAGLRRHRRVLAAVLIISIGAIVAVAALGGHPQRMAALLPADARGGLDVDARGEPAPPPGMIRVGGGTFVMGSNVDEIEAAYQLCRTTAGDRCRRDVYEREQPAREVTLSDFFLDRYEVTNQDFARWLGGAAAHADRAGDVHIGGDLVAHVDDRVAGLVREPAGAAAGRVGAGLGRRPVVLVTWRGAQHYCEDRGGALPSEAQWELAARGLDRRTFPWGSGKPGCSDVVFGRTGGPGARAGGCAGGSVADVGAHPLDCTPEGICDLGGNVSEWVLDGFVERYPRCASPCRDPVTGPAALAVVRGGNGLLDIEALRGAGRSKQPAAIPIANVGFRCASPSQP